MNRNTYKPVWPWGWRKYALSLEQQLSDVVQTMVKLEVQRDRALDALEEIEQIADTQISTSSPWRNRNEPGNLQRGA